MQKWMVAITVSLMVFMQLGLSGCAFTGRSPQQSVLIQPITKRNVLPYFTMVDNHTDIPFIIRSGQQAEIWISAPPDLLSKVYYEVRGQRLHLYTTKLSKAEFMRLSQIEMTLCVPDLSIFNHYGSGTIHASGLVVQKLDIMSSGRGSIYLDDISSNGLSIVNKGSGNIFVQGRVTLDHVAQFGRGHIKVQRVRSPKLRVYATGPGMISVSGSVDAVDIFLGDGAFFDGKYLQIGSGYVNAQGSAVAHIRMYDAQNLLVGDTGNIYFHQDPRFQAQYATGFGSMIRMTGMEPQDLCF